MMQIRKRLQQTALLFVFALALSVEVGADAQTTPPGGTTAPLLWLKADAGVYSNAGTTAAVNGGVVQEWVDQSGKGTVFAQTAGDRQPVLVNRDVNGQPAVRFTYNSGSMVNLATSGLSSKSGSYTAFMVVSNSPAPGGLPAWGLDSQNGRLVLAAGNSGAAYGWYDGSYHYFGAFTPGWHILEWALTAGANGEVLVNGVSQGTAPYTPQPLGGTTALGGAYDTNGAPLNGDIAEVLVYNSALPASERTSLRAALAAKYALSAAAGAAGGVAAPTPAPASPSASSTAMITPDNAGLLYSPYNWLVTAGFAKTINAGAYFRTRINATATCKIDLSVGPAMPYSQIYARLDEGAWQQYVPTAAGPQTWALTMPPVTTSPNHLLEFIVKSTTETQDRWNSQATAIQFTGLTLDGGATVTRPASRKYRVLIFGDSITEGVRVNGYIGIPNDTDRNDSTLDYAYKLGELLDAETGVVGFGATGVTVGGSGGVPALPISYSLLWSGQARSFSPVPDLVIYNEGANEGGAALADEKAAFATVVNGIGHTGTANTFAGLNGTRHLILRPFNGAQAANLPAVAASFGSANVVYGDTTGFWSGADASDGLHPYAYAHLGQIAPQVAALALSLLHPTGGTKRAQH